SENQWKWEIDSFIGMKDDDLLEVGIVRRITRNDLCVVACDTHLTAAHIQEVNKVEAERFTLKIDKEQSTALVEQTEEFIRSKTVIFGQFKEQLRLKGSDVNDKQIPGGSNSLTLENKGAAKSLKPGKPIVIEQPGQSFMTSVQQVNADGVITLDASLPVGFVTGNTVIRANVVLAGHGETQPERILGSGNATLSNQEFLFPVADVSFVSDEAQVSGVKADIRIIVDGETWTQVPRFNQSRATDPHYALRVTEDGYLRIVFGDGTNGRRLPTGENNVRIAWRMGSGTVGNLKAGSLKKLAYPHPRVESVEQPISCVGGNDMESVTSLRRSAPASLSTMERAVSVKDFAELAISHSSVWNAHAELTSINNERVVCVTVVPAQGGKLGESLEKELEAFLLAHAVPGVRVELKGYESEIMTLYITLSINSSRFDPELVKAEVRKVLLQNFTLKNRAIGAPVYLSDVYQLVEAVRGVEYSVCKFSDNYGDAQFLYPGAHGVFYMEHEEHIQLEWEEVKQ
ncbi:MAG: hypothetical protein LBE22_01895, partial [Azoarcus sp.]|nr:hypothetical protein [Azoarcus sp.]